MDIFASRDDLASFGIIRILYQTGYLSVISQSYIHCCWCLIGFLFRLLFKLSVEYPSLFFSVKYLCIIVYIFRLLTPPGTPLFPSLEMEGQKTVMSQLGTPKARPTALKSRVSNPTFFYSVL